MWEWTVKKAEHRKIDAFELWCWRRLLRVPWTARRSNLSVLKGVSPEYSLEGMMLKLKLQYSTWCKELTHLKRPWCWERLRAGGEGDDRGWDGWMASMSWWTWVWVNSRRWCWTGRPGVLRFMGSQRVGHEWATELNWTEVLSMNSYEQWQITCHFIIKYYFFLNQKSCPLLLQRSQLCSTLCDPVDCGLPGSSVHGIFQARILDSPAYSFSRGSFPTQESNSSLLYCRQIFKPLNQQGRLHFYYNLKPSRTNLSCMAGR